MMIDKKEYILLNFEEKLALEIIKEIDKNNMLKNKEINSETTRLIFLEYLSFSWNNSEKRLYYWWNIFENIKENDSLYRNLTKIQKLMLQMGYEFKEIR